jgi:hypothetical protein
MGRKFTIPIVVDRNYDGNAGRFKLVPDNFSRAHFGHAPEGSLSSDLRNELTGLIRDHRNQRRS